MSGRRSGGLTAEERRLWEAVARLVTPLKGRLRVTTRAAASPAKAIAPEAVKPAPAPPPKPKAAARTPASAPKPLPTPAPLAHAAPLFPSLALERRQHRALRRGKDGADAVLDLHGMRQSEAHAALHGFLLRSGAAGHRVVLVVTGKGPETADPFSERGVLRRSVPRWLALPEMRRLVVGVEEAGRRHGGAGALYVRLRRPDGT